MLTTNASAAEYKVKKGDTLYHIANKYHVTISDLKNWNNLKSDIIYVDQILKINIPEKNTSKNTTPLNPSKLPTNVKKYTVKQGDTLIKIANQNKISLAELKLWNNIKSHIIYPGQVLIVSKPKSAENTSEPQNQKTKNNTTNAPHQSNQSNKNKTSEINSNEFYTVEKGDTLSKIALAFGVTVQELKSWNNLSSDLIFVGQKLKIKNKRDTTDTKNNGQNGDQTNNNQSDQWAQAMINEAKKLLGIKYVWGGSTPSGFDCSGFIYYVFNKAGKSIQRLSSEGYYNRSYYVNDPQPGDLVFFENTYKKGISHLGIYLGDKQFIHASTDGVTISNLEQQYYKERFDGFKRFY